MQLSMKGVYGIVKYDIIRYKWIDHVTTDSNSVEMECSISYFSGCLIGKR